MRTKTVAKSCLLACLPIIMSGSLWAASAKDIAISPMLIHIAPIDKTEDVTSDDPAFAANNGVVPGLDLSASSETIPGLALTYFISEKLAVETYLAFPPTHDVYISGFPGIDKAATADLLPLSLSGQYHQAIAETRFTLVGGIGLIYAMFEDIDTSATLSQLDPSLTFSADDTFGFSFQLGAEYKLNDKFNLRAMYTKMLLEADITVKTSMPNLGNLSSTLTLNPDIFMVGVAYKL